MYKEHLNNLKKQLDKTVEHFKNELATFHTGRATPMLLDDVAILAYGSSMPLKQLAVITTAEPRVLSVQPWDKGILADIEKAIRLQKPNLAPSVAGDIVQVAIPALDQEQRRGMVKILNQKMEEARISIRCQREETWRLIQNLEKEKQLREDDKFRAKDELQKITDDYNNNLEKISQEREKELMAI